MYCISGGNVLVIASRWRVTSAVDTEIRNFLPISGTTFLTLTIVFPKYLFERLWRSILCAWQIWNRLSRMFFVVVMRRKVYGFYGTPPLGKTICNFNKCPSRCGKTSNSVRRQMTALLMVRGTLLIVESPYEQDKIGRSLYRVRSKCDCIVPRDVAWEIYIWQLVGCVRQLGSRPMIRNSHSLSTHDYRSLLFFLSIVRRPTLGLSFKSRLPSTSPNLPILLSQNWLLLSSKMQTGRMKIYVLALCFAASSAQMEYFQVGRVERWRWKRPRGRCHDESNVHPLCL